MIGWRTKLLAMVVVNIRYMIIHWNAVCANAFVSTLILKERGWIVDADAWLCVVDLRTQKHQQAGPRWREVVHCVHKKGKKTGLEAPIQPQKCFIWPLNIHQFLGDTLNKFSFTKVRKISYISHYFSSLLVDVVIMYAVSILMYI